MKHFSLCTLDNQRKVVVVTELLEGGKGLRLLYTIQNYHVF